MRFISDIISSQTQLEDQFLHSSKFSLFSFIVLKTVVIAVRELKKSGRKDEN